MTPWIHFIMTMLIITNLLLVGSSRLGLCIKTVALQGIILGFLPLLTEGGSPAVALSAFVLKGVVFPWLLLRAIRTTGIKREVEPYIGYAPSLMIGILNLIAATFLSSRLGLPGNLAIPLFTMLTGLFIIITRKKAISMVLGYIVLENGIFAFGTAITTIPLIVELGVLLDVFVAVFAMGIATCQIRREFDHVDVDQLDELKG